MFCLKIKKESLYGYQKTSFTVYLCIYLCLTRNFLFLTIHFNWSDHEMTLLVIILFGLQLKFWHIKRERFWLQKQKAFPTLMFHSKILFHLFVIQVNRFDFSCMKYTYIEQKSIESDSKFDFISSEKRLCGQGRTQTEPGTVRWVPGGCYNTPNWERASRWSRIRAEMSAATWNHVFLCQSLPQVSWETG